MKVWRIHIKNDIDSKYTRRDLLEFCMKQKLIGVGWAEIRTRVNSQDEIHKEAQVYSNATAAVKALNAMRKMELNDLIWTRLDSKYYLCRVIGLWKDSKPNDDHCKFDISNYVNVEWIEIGMEQNVPGKVLNSFRPAASAQCVCDMEDISMYLWDKYSKTTEYKINRNDLNIWSVLSAEAIEEIVLLYLQIEKDYHIFSSTVKHAFPTYECQMVNIEGKHAYPQVKSGGVSLNANDYMEAVNQDENAEVYLFSTSESYTKNNCERVHFIYKNELENFIRNNKNLLPDLTYNWIALCGFFNKES